MIKYIFIIIFSTQVFFAKDVNFTVFAFKGMDEITQVEHSKSYLGRLKNILEEERKAVSSQITFHGGNFFAPTAYGKIDKGFHVIDLLNSLKIDFISLGSHEMDFGLDILKKRISESNFKWISSNIIAVDKRLKNLEDASIYQVEDVKIAFFSLMSPQIAKKTNASDQICLLPNLDIAYEKHRALKNLDVDVFVLTIHGSLEESIDIAKKLPFIDVIINTKSDEYISFYEGGYSSLFFRQRKRTFD